MTVSSNVNRWRYDGDGATTSFAYTGRIFATSDLLVYVDGVLQTLTTHYSVTGANVDGGGNVVFVLAPAAGTDNVLIVRAVPYAQPDTLPSNGNLPSGTLNKIFDRLTILGVQLLDLATRTLRQPESDVDAIGRIPAKADRAGKYAAYDADGDPIATAGTADATVISSFMATVLDDASAAAARATLGAKQSAYRGCLLKRSATQSIATATPTAIQFDAETYDTDAIHSTSSNTSRLTVPAGATKVKLQGSVNWATSAVGTGAYITMTKNGASFPGVPLTYTPTLSIGCIASPVLEVTAGDYFEIVVNQNSGGAVNIQASDSTWAALEIVE